MQLSAHPSPTYSPAPSTLAERIAAFDYLDEAGMNTEYFSYGPAMALIEELRGTTDHDRIKKAVGALGVSLSEQARAGDTDAGELQCKLFTEAGLRDFFLTLTLHCQELITSGDQRGVYGMSLQECQAFATLVADGFHPRKMEEGGGAAGGSGLFQNYLSSSETHNTSRPSDARRGREHH